MSLEDAQSLDKFSNMNFPSCESCDGFQNVGPMLIRRSDKNVIGFQSRNVFVPVNADTFDLFAMLSRITIK